MTTENKPFDSTEGTKKHIARVNDLLTLCALNLSHRGDIHDASKLVEPEKSGFDACIPKLDNLTYGSDEYRAAFREIKPTLEHHYAHNSHHPEHYGPYAIDMSHPLYELKMFLEQALVPFNSSKEEYLKTVKALVSVEESNVHGMNLFDVIEMLMDWKAATERMKDGGDIRKSLAHNIGRFGLSSQLAAILKNTIEYMGW